LGKITLAGFLIANRMEDADRASVLLPEHIRLTRAEAGCLSFEVWRSRSDPLRFGVHEVFRDRPAFDAHQARTKESAWATGTQTLVREYTLTEDGD
jgi:quinol monooxygenase YgiN